MPPRWLLLSIGAVVVAAAVLALIRTMLITRDGSSPERAVVLHVSEDKIAHAEWDWWRKRYPDAGLLPIIHSMEGHKGRIYSRYLISTPKGEKEVFFATNMKDDDK
jgi:hypothetical protein